MGENAFRVPLAGVSVLPGEEQVSHLHQHPCGVRATAARGGLRIYFPIDTTGNGASFSRALETEISDQYFTAISLDYSLYGDSFR